MGSDKALETIGGESLIRRTVATLEHFQGDLFVAAGSERRDMGLDGLPRVRLVEDIYPGRGPLAGIHSGLKASDTFYNIVVACDMPFLNVDLLEYMAGIAEGYDAVAARLEDSPEPLQAIYGRSCLEPIEAMLSEDVNQTNYLFERINVRYIGASELDRFDPQRLSFFNINTRSDMAKARELAGNQEI